MSVSPGRTGYLGLGSNVGGRRANLLAAVAGLGDAGVPVAASSSVYATAPVGLVLDQPEFLNACLRVTVPAGLSPRQLLEIVKSLEASLGRVPGGVRHGPRVIDIDILLLGGERHSDDRLVVPHPGVAERRFVLVPLLELDPDLVLPGGERLDARLAGLEDQPVRRAGPPLI